MGREEAAYTAIFPATLATAACPVTVRSCGRKLHDRTATSVMTKGAATCHHGRPVAADATDFHSSTISGSASCMISRTFASVFPRQSPKFLDLLVDIVLLLFTFMYFRSSTRRRFPLQFDLIVIHGGTDEIF